MNVAVHPESRYARCIEASRRMRWDIDTDVIRGREPDFTRPFLPAGLTRIDDVDFLGSADRILSSQIQGRTYANMFGLVERFIGAKILEVTRTHWLGDQVALEALVRFADEEIKHQALFRRIEVLVAAGMADGYAFRADPNDVAGAVLGASNWAVLALTCHIELFTQAHYRASLMPAEDICPLFRDVFMYHWREESQHAILDELEWRREDARLTPLERESAVSDLIGLVGAIDSILQTQAGEDARYFLATCGRSLSMAQFESLKAAFLDGYRWQYIGSGLIDPRFNGLLEQLLAPPQLERLRAAAAPFIPVNRHPERVIPAMRATS